MRLIRLVLKHFKGIQYFELIADGKNIIVYGDNATGKTTLFDGCNWLLFDKDSQNKKDFQIKTLDESGNVTHNLEHEAEGTFEINNKTVTIRKIYSEKWTQKRGSITKEFSGHTTEYFIDGVPVPKKEYDKYIGEIVNESLFKLVTNPSYFNEYLSWQERRKTLLDICGDISDEEVIHSDQTLAKLPAILQGRKLEDHRKVIASRQTAINKELKEIPSRIDEVQRGLPDISSIFSREVITTEIQSLRTQQQSKRQEVMRIENGGETAEKQKALREIESQIIGIQNRFNIENGDKVLAKKSAINDLRLQVSDIGSQITVKNRFIERNNAEIKRCDTSRNILRDKWHSVTTREFTFHQECFCPTCGQDLPESQITAVKEKALEQFNLSKSKELEAINADGSLYKEKTAELQDANRKLQTDIQVLTADRISIENQINDLQTTLDSMSVISSIETDPEYIKASEEETVIHEQITVLNNQKQTLIRSLQSEIILLNSDILSRERSMAQLDQYDKGQERIKELSAQEKDLAAEYEKLSGQLYLTEQFIRTKVNMLESRINSQFKYARFKLFDVQINGGVNECCETLYKGVPYGSGLNNAAKINVGLDILNTLSTHYGFTAPIFIDNAESVTELIETKAQMISLVVSSPDKVLRVEYVGNVLKEAV